MKHIPETLVNIILDSIKFKYFEEDDILYWYDSNRGIYRPDGEDLINNILSRIKMPDYYHRICTDYIEDNDIGEIKNQIEDIIDNILSEMRDGQNARPN